MKAILIENDFIIKSLRMIFPTFRVYEITEIESISSIYNITSITNHIYSINKTKVYNENYFIILDKK